MVTKKTETEKTLYAENKSDNMSESTDKFSAAMLEAHKSFETAKKTGFNDHIKKSYSNIDDIYRAVKMALNDNKIYIKHFRYVQYSEPLNKYITFIETRLVHAPSGQWIKDVSLLEPDKPGCQGIGAAITYMRKYAVLMLCAIPCEDDDGKEGQKYVEERKNKQPDTVKKEPLIDELQTQYLRDALAGRNDIAKRLREKLSSEYKIYSYGAIPARMYQDVVNWIAQQKVTPEEVRKA